MVSALKLYAVKYAESVFGENYIFEGGNPDISLPIDFTLFLFETDGRRILVDAGCDTMPGWDMRHFESPSVILERASIPVDSITDVILTHSHHDHVEAVRYFKNAVIHVQKEEYNLCKSYIPDNFVLDIFDAECRLPNGITVLKIGGHSIGSCVVEFPMNNKIGVISGDEIYYLKVLENARENSTAREKSPFLRKYFDDKKYEVLVMHQPMYLPNSNGVELIFESERNKI